MFDQCILIKEPAIIYHLRGVGVGGFCVGSHGFQGERSGNQSSPIAFKGVIR